MILDYLSECEHKPRVLKILGQKYGGANRIKFVKFGFGPWGQFLRQHPEIGIVQHKLKFMDSIHTILVSEQVLINIVERVGIKYGLSEIRNIYGNGPFKRFGYGTYVEFVTRNNLSY